MPDRRPGNRPARRVNVTFSPPTPNGDLHLGHLAGPVLNSDICARSQKILGSDVAFSTSTDDNQTYVVTTAVRIGVTPEDLIRRALAEMTDSLQLGGIAVDLFERPDADYERFVRHFFTTLWQKGAFDQREVYLPYDDEAGAYRAEAFVTGRCPTCLAHARAGVCETCGLYNLPQALLPMVDDIGRLPRRPVRIWTLDLERYRARIEAWYERSDVGMRPDLERVVRETLRDRLPYIPITYPIDWGISVDWDGPDAPPQTINAWPEIYVGHVYWLNQARADTRGCDELVQFIGIDNGFYNAFVYLALSLLGSEHGLPVTLPKTRTLTNQYYLLEGRKFSTSKGDVLWAGDYLRSAGRDRARFLLALTSPEVQKAEFVETVAADTLTSRFDQPVTTIEAALRLLVGCEIGDAPSPWWQRAIDASVGRFEASYDLAHFSIRGAAEALALHLEVLALRLETLDLNDPAEISGALAFLWTLRTLAWPVTPDLADNVARCFAEPAGQGIVPLLDEIGRTAPGPLCSAELTHRQPLADHAVATGPALATSGI